MTEEFANQDQLEYWNGAAGQHWVDRQEALDIMLAPAAVATNASAQAKPGERILDIGCGCGGTSIELARRVGATGRVVGIDISAPMLEWAAQRLPPGLPVHYVLADATTHIFEEGSFDALFSRFGVMFFADPVRTFTNLRRALRPRGRLAFSCWRTPKENPWMMVPLQAAYEHLPKPEPLPPEAPGPFSFASAERVRGILDAAGFQSIGLEAVDLEIDIASGRGLDAAVASALEIGATSRLVEGQPAEVRAAVAESVRRVLAPYQRGNRVPLGGAIWIVSAKNS